MNPILSALWPLMLFSQAAARWHSMGWADIAIAIIVLAGIFAIVVVVLRHLNVPIPPIVVALFWILVAVVCGVFAIRFLSNM